MNRALVNKILNAIAENTPSQFDRDEPAEAVAWLKNRIWVTPRDKGAEPQYFPEVAAACAAANQAVNRYEAGDVDEARTFALKALTALGAPRPPETYP